MVKVAKQNFERNPKDQKLANKFLYYEKQYKKCLKKAEKQHTKDLTNALLNMESNNPKEVWAIINRMRNRGSESNDQADNIEASK